MVWGDARSCAFRLSCPSAAALEPSSRGRLRDGVAMSEDEDDDDEEEEKEDEASTGTEVLAGTGTREQMFSRLASAAALTHSSSAGKMSGS
mmetsp:Transcript_11057/g.29587  ORF Transcript_11057/g.29587 Transcript_11057/m.29587 type:complete len:91 (-) Transcript_11057:2837-3109(-)